MTEIPDGIYEIANAADLVCQKGHCQRGDCNGFLCREAIDAVFLAAEKRGEERGARVLDVKAEESNRICDFDMAKHYRKLAAAIRKGQQ